MTSHMDRARKAKDKTYKNVFKGSVLISSLLEQDEKKFKDRETAVKVCKRVKRIHRKLVLQNIITGIHSQSETRLSL